MNYEVPCSVTSQIPYSLHLLYPQRFPLFADFYCPRAKRIQLESTREREGGLTVSANSAYPYSRLHSSQLQQCGALVYMNSVAG
jgi:hypothetical protein